MFLFYLLDLQCFSYLLHAAKFNSVGVAELLAKSGAKLNETDNTGKTASRWAFDLGYLELSMIIIAYGGK